MSHFMQKATNYQLANEVVAAEGKII